MPEIKIITNNVPRDVIEGYQLTEKERSEFDYINWDAVEDGRDSASFFRYHGQLYYMESEGTPAFAPGWDAYLSDSFFSGIVYRFPVDTDSPANRDGDVNYDWEKVVVGTYYVKG